MKRTAKALMYCLAIYFLVYLVFPIFGSRLVSLRPSITKAINPFTFFNLRILFFYGFVDLLILFFFTFLISLLSGKLSIAQCSKKTIALSSIMFFLLDLASNLFFVFTFYLSVHELSLGQINILTPALRAMTVYCAMLLGSLIVSGS